MPKSKLFTCHRCGKRKAEKDGYLKLGKVLFCCKECCADDQKKDQGKAPKICEFC